MNLHVVVTAAGQSRRMGGGNKLLLDLFGKPVLLYSVCLFQSLPYVKTIVVSAHQDYIDTYKELFAKANLDKVKAVVCGGKERQDSIFHALNTLDELKCNKEDLVAVHDGARPLITKELVDLLCESCAHNDGAIPGLEPKDTVKHIDNERTVTQTYVRSELTCVQTPQVFPLGRLLDAYKINIAQGRYVTDDASFIENLGGKVKVVPGDYRNIKITEATDLILAQMLLKGTSHV